MTSLLRNLCVSSSWLQIHPLLVNPDSIHSVQEDVVFFLFHSKFWFIASCSGLVKKLSWPITYFWLLFKNFIGSTFGHNLISDVIAGVSHQLPRQNMRITDWGVSGSAACLKVSAVRECMDLPLNCHFAAYVFICLTTHPATTATLFMTLSPSYIDFLQQNDL